MSNACKHNEYDSQHGFSVYRLGSFQRDAYGFVIV